MKNGFAVKVRDSTSGKACMCGDRTFYLHVKSKNLHVLDKNCLVMQEVGVFYNPDAVITTR